MRSHLFRMLLRQYIEHKDPSNLRVHLWSNALMWIGLTTLLSHVPVPVAVPMLGANVGAWWVTLSVIYWMTFDPGVSLLVLSFSVVFASLPFFPWGPEADWNAGVVAPLIILNLGGLAAFLSHIYYHEHAEYLKTGNPLRDALETTHAVMWGPFHFWLFGLLKAGYRSALRAEFEAAERRRILRSEGTAWANWGRNIQCHPEVMCVPLTIDDLCNVVRDASREGRKIRMVSSGFNWSGLAATDDTLVFCERLNHVEVDAGQQTVWAECGTTNRQLNRTLAAAGLQMPWNVVLENVRVAGIVAVGTHGSGKDTGTMGDLVEAFDVIDADGNRRILSEATVGVEAMNAARLGLGLFGVIARVKLRAERTCHILEVDRRMSIDEALAVLPDAVRNCDSVELSWFPFTDWVWLRTLERTDLPVTFNSHGLLFLAKNFFDMIMLGGVLSSASKRFPKLIPPIMRRLSALVTFRERVLTMPDALHYRQWLELHRCACIEAGFKTDPSLEKVGHAFRASMKLVGEWAARGLYPLDLFINVRFVGPSRAMLSPAYGPGLTCFIEALSTRRTAEWKTFTTEMYSLWFSSDPSALPHWAKEFEHVPGIEFIVRERLGDRLTKFRAALNDTGIDRHGTFVSERIDRILEINKVDSHVRFA